MIFHANNAYEILPEVISCGIKKIRTIIEIYFHLGMHNKIDDLMLPMMSKKQEKLKRRSQKTRIYCKTEMLNNT